MSGPCDLYGNPVSGSLLPSAARVTPVVVRRQMWARRVALDAGGNVVPPTTAARPLGATVGQWPAPPGVDGPQWEVLIGSRSSQFSQSGAVTRAEIPFGNVRQGVGSLIRIALSVDPENNVRWHDLRGTVITPPSASVQVTTMLPAGSVRLDEGGVLAPDAVNTFVVAEEVAIMARPVWGARATTPCRAVDVLLVEPATPVVLPLAPGAAYATAMWLPWLAAGGTLDPELLWFQISGVETPVAPMPLATRVPCSSQVAVSTGADAVAQMTLTVEHEAPW